MSTLLGGVITIILDVPQIQQSHFSSPKLRTFGTRLVQSTQAETKIDYFNPRPSGKFQAPCSQSHGLPIDRPLQLKTMKSAQVPTSFGIYKGSSTMYKSLLLPSIRFMKALQAPYCKVLIELSAMRNKQIKEMAQSSQKLRDVRGWEGLPLC